MKQPSIPTYEVLKEAYAKTGQRVMTEKGSFDVWSVHWQVIGFAESMEDAKAKFGGSPVLQRAVVPAVKH